MTKTIFKYQLQIAPNIQEIELPLNAEVLNVNIQNNSIMLWAMIDTEQSRKESVKILCVGTGHNIPEGNWYYINTIYPDPFVFHYFVMGKDIPEYIA